MPSRIPTELIEDTLVYNSNLEAYQRKDNATKCINPVSKDKQNEFLWLLEKKTNCKFNESEWEHDEMDCHEDPGLCVCSQQIQYTFRIKHTPTGKAFIVGSECVKKFSQSLYHQLVKPKCVICSAPILDRRTRLGKLNMCSEACSSSVLPFGKYKNQELSTIPISYLEWLFKQDWVNDRTKNMITVHVFEKPTRKKKHNHWLFRHNYIGFNVQILKNKISRYYINVR